MKKNTIILCCVFLLLAVLTQSAMAQNKIKKVKYMNHKYYGEVTSKKVPDGEGAIEFYGDKEFIKGFFQANYVKNATFDCSYIQYTGDLTFDESNYITLKKGGTITYDYRLPPYYEDKEEDWQVKNWKNKLFNGKIHQLLTKDKKIGVSFINEDQKVVPFPIMFVDEGKAKEMEVPLVPIEVMLELKRDLYGKWTYFINEESLKHPRVKEFKDDQGRIWNFYGYNRYKVTYPDNSFFSRTGDDSKDVKLRVNIPDLGVAEVDGAQLRFKLNNRSEILFGLSDNFGFAAERDFIEMQKSDLSNVSSHFANTSSDYAEVLFSDKDLENMSDNEVEKLIRERIVSKFGERKYFVKSRTDGGSYGRFKDYSFYGRFSKLEDSNYSYLSWENESKLENAYNAEKQAERKKAEDAFDADLKKQFGFNPSYAPLSSLVSNGQKFYSVKNYLERYGYNGKIYYFRIAADYGYSKNYYLYKKLYYFGSGQANPRVAIVSVSNNKITSVRWY